MGNSAKKIIVISATHLGDCLMGASFEPASKLLTVEHLRQNLIARQRISLAVVEVARAMMGASGGSVPVVVVENTVLSRYIETTCTHLDGFRRPLERAIDPGTVQTLLYKTHCCITEGNLETAPSTSLDELEMALSGEDNPDRISGHLARCLALAVDQFFDPTQRPVMMPAFG